MGPLYQCIKEVRALRITAINGYWLTFSDPSYQPYECPPVMFARYEPNPGDYLVTYEDGYRAISPASAFDKGYQPVEEPR